MSLAARLKELRSAKGVSLQKLANAVGSSKPHIWGLECGRTNNPSLELIIRLANFFGVSVDYLISGETSTDDLSPAVKGFVGELADKKFSEADLSILKAVADALEKNKDG